MAIQTRSSINTSNVKDQFAEIFRESAETFKSDHIDVLGAGFKDIALNESLFESYVEQLSEGLDATAAEEFTMLANNTRQNLLESFQDIAPVHSLALPTLRRFWPRLAMTQVIPTHPIDAPSVTMGVMVPYLTDLEGNTHRLPSEAGNVSSNGRLKLKLDKVAVPSAGHDVFKDTGASASARDAVDIDFRLVSVEVNVAEDGQSEDIKTVKVVKRIDSATNAIHAAIIHDGQEIDTLFVLVDRSKAILKQSSLAGRVKTASFEGYVSSEYMNRAEEVTFHVERRNIDIGSGDPLAASITNQTVQDAGALYNIDTHMSLADTASKVLAQKHDTRAMEFVEDIHEQNGMAGSEFGKFEKSFDMHPPAQFSGAPSEWREELKRVIDYTVEDMKSSYHMTGGEVRLYGHNLDTDAIHNKNWIFQGNNGDEVGGVSVDHSVGTYQTGNGKTTVVSTSNVSKAKRGTLRAVFVPSQEDQVTLRYLPYSFTLNDASSGYRNPNTPNVPGFVMNRRDEFFCELPMVAAVKLQNNDGTLIG